MVEVISYLAVSTLVGDFDGYWHSHNYFLYENGPGGLWGLIPWGIDRVFNDHVSVFGSGGRLAELCFADSSCRLRYVRRLLQLADLMDSQNLEREMRRLFALLGKAANEDPIDETTLDQRQRKNRPGEIREALDCLVDGEEVDVDGDGYGCNDCALEDPKIHPGAIERCDGIDNNCDGLRDNSPACPCEIVEVGGAEFHLCEWRLSWSEARDFCQAKGMGLAIIDDAEQNQAVFSRALELDDNRWWLGASDLGKEGRWRSIRGKPLTYLHWGERYPGNKQCGQDCLSFDDAGEGTWADSHCEQNFPFVCR